MLVSMAVRSTVDLEEANKIHSEKWWSIPIDPPNPPLAKPTVFVADVVSTFPFNLAVHSVGVVTALYKFN